MSRLGKDRHAGYDLLKEEEQKRRENVIFNMKSTADEHISDFSSYMVQEIQTEKDPVEAQKKLTHWVSGLLKLYGSK